MKRAAAAQQALRITVMLLLLCLALAGTCTTGPYLVDDSCGIISQGIGSSMNRMKTAVLLAQVYGARLLANPQCFHSTEHKSDLLDYFGWDSGADCSYADLQGARPFSQQDTGGGLLRLQVTTYNKVAAEADNNKQQNAAVDELCRAVHAGSDLAQLLDAHGQGQDGGNALLPQMNRAKALLAAAAAGVARRTVLVLGDRYLIEGHLCTTGFLRERWGARREAALAAGSLKPAHDEQRVTVAFHLRHGDVATKDINWLDPYKEVRTIPLKQGVDVLKALLGPDSLLHGAAVDVKLYSEGRAEEFAAFIEAFPAPLGTLVLGDASTLAADMDALATADVLLASPSSFTALVAALNRDGVVLAAAENAEKFEGVSNAVPQATLLKGVLSPFNALMCQQKLYTKLARRLCGKSEPEELYTVGQSHSHGHEIHRVSSSADLHVEIKRLRKKLNELPPELTSESIQSELHSASALWKHFTYETRAVSCHRNASIADFRARDDSICDGKIRGKAHSVQAAQANLQLSYFVRQVAEDVAARGFQLPTYVVHGPNQKRRARLTENLRISGILDSSVVWQEGYLANNLTERDKASFALGNDAYYICKQILGEKPCHGGYPFSSMEMSVALKHIDIIRSIAAKVEARREKKGQNGGENSGGIAREYSLIIEDDQFLPRDLLRQVLEVLLQLPQGVGMVMLDDSFFYNGNFHPPKHMLNYPFPRTYEKNTTRTVGAYLLSNAAAVSMATGGHFLPLYAPVDHQLNYAIHKHAIPVHWVFPPMTCAGSQGVEVGISSSTGGTQMDPGDRWHCTTCCNRYYNTSSMQDLYTLTAN